MKFKGHDFGELTEAFDLGDEWEQLQELWEKNNLYDLYPQTDPEVLLIRRHIRNMFDFEKSVLEEKTREILLEFLSMLVKDKYLHPSSKKMLKALIELSFTEEDDWGFYSWFELMIPKMWS